MNGPLSGIGNIFEAARRPRATREVMEVKAGRTTADIRVDREQNGAEAINHAERCDWLYAVFS